MSGQDPAPPLLPVPVPPAPAPSHAGALVKGMARLAPKRRVWPVLIASLLFQMIQLVGHVWIVWRLTRPHEGATEGQGARRLARLLSPLGAILPVAVMPLWFSVMSVIDERAWALVNPQVVGALLATIGVMSSLEPLRRHLRRVFQGDARRAVLRPLHRAMGLFAIQGLVPAVLFVVLRAESVGGMGTLLSPIVAGPSALIAMAAGFGGWLMMLRLGATVGRLPVPEPGGTTPRLTRWRRALQEQHGLTVQPSHTGFTTDGRLSGLPATLWVDLSRHPASGELVVHLPALAATHPRLQIRARATDEPAGVALTDPILSRLVRIRGVSAAVANALVADLHDALLDVVQGLPGSALRAGRLVVPLELRPGEPEAGVDLDDAIARVTELAAALEDRAAG
jgi:hypothetical protein